MSETMESISENDASVRSLIARVASSRMEKSASVVVMRMVRHPLYGKFLRRRTKLLVHDEANECRDGDLVRISPCRPLSRHKAWRVVEIIERAAAAPAVADDVASDEETPQ